MRNDPSMKVIGKFVSKVRQNAAGNSLFRLKRTAVTTQVTEAIFERAVKCVSRETNRRGDSLLDLVSCVGHGVEQYTYSNHQTITFHVVGQQRWRTELQPTLARWNVRSFDLVSFGIVMEENVQLGINAEQMASSLMSLIDNACDAAISKTSKRDHQPRVLVE
ncbi:hypothetical protein J6590_106481 [Homalodisca vitripennis]|nr:hypothetical protein J6590_106481 [Homalodisca vitripennis]